MKLMPSLRTVGLLCAYAAIALAIPVEVSFWYLLLIIICCGLSVGLSYCLKRQKLLRFIPILVVLFPLVLASGIEEMCILIVPFLHIVILIISGRYEMDYLSFRTLFRVMAAFDILIIFIFICNQITDVYTYLLAYLSFMLLLFVARQLRMGNVQNAGTRLGEILCLLVFAAGTAGIAGVIYLIYYFELYLYPVKGIVAIIGGAIYSIVYLFSSANSIATGFGEGPTEIEEVESEISTEIYNSFPEASTASGEVANWAYILAAVIAIAVLVLIVRMIIKLVRSAGSIEFKEEMDYVGADGVYEGGAYLPKSKRERGNYVKLRKVYRDYLKYLMVRGCYHNSGDTSLDMYKKSVEKSHEFTNKEKHAKEARMRELYIRARYNPALPVTNADVKEARELLKEIKRI